MKTKAILALPLLICVTMTSCQLTVATDGTRTWSFSGEEAARAIIIYSK